MDYSYGPPDETYGLSRESKDTIAASLTDFMSVKVHLHVGLLPGQERYSVYELLDSLIKAIAKFQTRSWDLYLKHNMGNRRVIVHLGHLLSLWPNMYAGQNCVPVGALRALVDLLARDKMKDWELRYYVPTGQRNSTVVYGNSREEVAEDVRDGELAQLRYDAKLSGHDSITVVGEMYAGEKEWGCGDKTGAITRNRTPASEFWPNMHFDPSRYDISKRERFVKTFPGKSSFSLTLFQWLTRNAERMPVEYFDDEVLAATQATREDRKRWMKSLRSRDQRRAREYEERFQETVRAQMHGSSARQGSSTQADGDT